MDEVAGIKKTVEIEYDVVRESYGEFIGVLRKVLAEYEPAGDRHSVVDYHHLPHPVLPRQRSPHRPARWIHVTLLVRDEGHATTLAIRDDNVYLIGFRNRRGQWYEFGFSDGGGGRTRSARVLPAEYSSIFLECDVRYGAIIDGGARKLVKLGLGKWFARDAVRRLSAYEQQAAPGPGGGGGGGVDERTRRHLARLVVMVCEAARMIPHFETLLDGWDRCTAAITDRQVHLLWNWKLMSHAVLRALGVGRELDPPWPQELLAPQVDVRNVGQALQIVHLLLNWPGPRALASTSEPPPPPPSQDIAPDGDSGVADDSNILRHSCNDDATILGQHGQCMLEMFGMRAGFYMCGTVSVFDGIRGQTIYSNDDDDDKPDVDDDDGYLGRRTMSDSLDHDDVGELYGRRHFGEWMLSHLHSIYDWAGLRRWNHHSQTKTTITSKRENGSTPVHDLVLTGPYRAISGYGSVSIEIESSTSNDVDDDDDDVGISTTTDSIDVAAGKFTTDDYVRIDISKQNHHNHTDGKTTTTTTLLLWDCDDDDDAAYDRVLTRTISTSHGPLEVTYAVLSNAVEAAVQVRLLLADADAEQGADILVHGRITARCRGLDAQSTLFCQDAEEKVAVVVTGEDSHVPLSRSVVAVPLTSELLIAAALHTSVASSNHAAAQGLLHESVVARFRPEPSGQDVQHFGIDGGQVEIKVIWGLEF